VSVTTIVIIVKRTIALEELSRAACLFHRSCEWENAVRISYLLCHTWVSDSVWLNAVLVRTEWNTAYGKAYRYGNKRLCLSHRIKWL